jgi:hypothetical protein
MRPVHVAHIITKLELGGAQQNTLFTVANLNRNLFCPYLITNPEGILVPEARALKGVKIFFIPQLIRKINPLMDLLALRKIKQILREIKKNDSYSGEVGCQACHGRRDHPHHSWFWLS